MAKTCISCNNFLCKKTIEEINRYVNYAENICKRLY
jgi:hypothetical protein